MKFDYSAEYFNPEHTLECGQIFRFKKLDSGYVVYSADKACFIKNEGEKVIFECDDGDYFYNFFDLDRDYKKIVEAAKSFSVPLLTRSAEACKGLRILNQNREETIYSFIISQNNNIPRIKGIIEKICMNLGEKKSFSGQEYFAFPSSSSLASVGAEFYKNLGAGYRDTYLFETSKRISAEGIKKLDGLDAVALKRELLTYKGIGPKVADCISLFGFGKTESFPVDTWLEKVYREDFHGTLKGREKISKYFTELFKEYSGYVQQYLFYGKRLNL